MPVLKDMTKLYVGTSPVKKVYAGVSLVWEGVRVKQYASGSPWGADRFLWMVVIQSDMTPANCSTAGQQYAYRLKGASLGDNFSKWFQWNEAGYGFTQSGIVSGTSSNQCELYLGWQNNPAGLAFEFRRVVNGTTYTHFIDYGEVEDRNTLPIYNPQPATRVTVCASA